VAVDPTTATGYSEFSWSLEGSGEGGGSLYSSSFNLSQQVPLRPFIVLKQLYLLFFVPTELYSVLCANNN